VQHGQIRGRVVSCGGATCLRTHVQLCDGLRTAPVAAAATYGCGCEARRSEVNFVKSYANRESSRPFGKPRDPCERLSPFSVRSSAFSVWVKQRGGRGPVGSG
jgi:hypothetical protein